MSYLDQKLGPLVGDKTAKQLLESFEMRTVGDLLRHYPRRLDDRGQLTDLAYLRLDEHVTVLARVQSVKNHPFPARGRGRPGVRTEVVVTDGNKQLLLTFFNQRWQKDRLLPGTLGLFSGKVGEFRGKRQLTHPDCVLLGTGTDIDDVDEFNKRWIPIYPASAKVPTWKLSKSVSLVLPDVGDVPDLLPDDLRESRDLVTLAEAFRGVHDPDTREQWHAARARLKFDEAFVLQTVLAQRRYALLGFPAAPRPLKSGGLRERFEAQLPFLLTRGQLAVGQELAEDLAQPHPMHRLLQGEVGSGKTVVALRAMLQVVDAGGQAVLLAPTEVLAQQHHRSIMSILGPMGEAGMLGGADDATRVVLLTGSLGAAARRTALLDAASGASGIVVGTHALLEEKVQFADLGLVVVDEQHRFGVEQRAALTDKAGFTPPHVLVMTATPIPRTVAMTAFGDLEVSTLRELPTGRAGLRSSVVPVPERPTWLDRAWSRVREEVDHGHQVYVVCPRIGEAPSGAATSRSTMDEDFDTDVTPEGEDEQRRPPLAVLDVADQLSAGPLAGLRLEMLHGRMTSDAKDDVMRRFGEGLIDVLVATTVVEVGVDVPNASLMVVMDADRFGVSQLHQLRGRVGRGSVPGLCLFVTEAAEGSPARERLDGVAATTDGFELSRLDLENRREGDVLGSSQSGRRSSLKLLSVIRDETVIVDAREAAQTVVADDPALARNPTLAAAVRELVESEHAQYLEKS